MARGAQKTRRSMVNAQQLFDHRKDDVDSVRFFGPPVIRRHDHDLTYS
jgi:hypothetical protein